MTLRNKSGLDSKPAVLFIQKVSNFKSSIWIEKAERRVNAKSLLGLLALGVANGEKITVIAEGEDESQAVQELKEYLELGLGESV